MNPETSRPGRQEGHLLINLLYNEASLLDLARISENDPTAYGRKVAQTALAVRLHDLEAKTGCDTGWETVL